MVSSVAEVVGEGARALRIDAGVNVTLAHPHVDVLALGHATHVGTEEHVRQKENLLIRGDGIDDLDGVPGSTAVVAFRFDFGGGIHIRDDDCARMLGLPVS